MLTVGLIIVWGTSMIVAYDMGRKIDYVQAEFIERKEDE